MEDEFDSDPRAFVQAVHEMHVPRALAERLEASLQRLEADTGERPLLQMRNILTGHHQWQPAASWILSSAALACIRERTLGLSRKTADTGALALIQRLGSTLNLTIHFHSLLF